MAGLDVYLHWYADYEQSKRVREDFRKVKSDLEAKAVTPAQKKAVATELDRLRKEWLVDSDGNDAAQRLVVHPSKKHPYHLFTVGYFRGSYNPGGFNLVLNQLIGEDLYTIFEIKQEPEEDVLPDWARVKQRVAEVRKKLEGKEANLEWHLQALDVVEETADFILSGSEPEKYRLRWSES